MIQMNLFAEQKQTHRFRLGWTGNHMDFEGVEKARKWEVDVIMLSPSPPALKEHHARYMSMMASANGLF